MVNRDTGYRQKSAVETAISAASIRARFSTGALRSGFPKNGFAPVNDTFHIDHRNEGFEQGARANPGDSGFLYADTPQATIFVGKKQWLSDTWTYVAEFEQGANPIPGSRIPERIDRRTRIGVDNEDGNCEGVRTTINDEAIAQRLKEGRLYETQKRDVYERIVTRKLQWLSDYEAIYKLTNKLNVAQELGRITPDLKEQLLSRLSDDEPSALLASDFDLLADLEVLPTGLGNSNTTRYYTSPIVDEEADGAANRYARKLFQLRTLEKFAGPDSAEALDALIENQEQSVSNLKEQRDSLTQQIEQLTLSINQARQQIREQTVLETPIPEGYGESQGRSIVQELAEAERALRVAISERENILRVLFQAEALLAEYNERRSGDVNIEDLRREVADLKREADEQFASEERLVPFNAFNGIIEFNNITSISTSLNINGGGTASFTMENPMNILRISQEDFLLALNDDPYLESSITGNSEDETETIISPEWKTGSDSSDDNNPYFDSPNAEANTGNLVFYKGQYYSPHVLEIVLKNGGGVLDARTGINISEPSNLLNQYRNTQRAIFEEINNRIGTLPAQFREELLQILGIPTTTRQITSVFIKENRSVLVGLFNGSTAQVEEDEENAQTFGAIIVDGYLETLVRLEQEIGPLLDFKTSEFQTTKDDSDPEKAEQSEPAKTKRESTRVFKLLDRTTTLKNPNVQKRFYSDLMKHFNGKWLVEAGDRVWFWLSSPSRTIQIDREGLGLVETAIGRAAAELSNQGEYRALRRQLDDLEQLILNKKREVDGERDQLAILESDLVSAGVLIEQEDSADPFLIDSDFVNDNIPGVSEFNPQIEQDLERYESLKVVIRENEAELQPLLLERDEIYRELEKLENEIVPERKTREQGSSQNANNAGGNLREPREDDFSSVTAGDTIGQVPLSGVLFSTYGGLEETQHQVFEGVVTQVTGTFTGEGFTLSVSCRDLTFYLDMTRVMERPNLNSNDVIALLNDPIYRYIPGTAYENFCGGRFRNAIPDPKDINGHPLAGRWKSGLFVTSALVDPKIQQQIPPQDVLSEEELTCLHGLTPFSKLYSNLDTANLISLLVTGVPFDFSLYLFSTTGYDVANLSEPSGQVRPNPNSPFEVLRALVGAQNRHLGDFEPFLELTDSYDRRRLEQLENLIKEGEERVKRLMRSRQERTPRAIAVDEYITYLINKAKGLPARLPLFPEDSPFADRFPAEEREVRSTLSGVQFMRSALRNAQGGGGSNESLSGGRIRILQGLEEQAWLRFFDNYIQESFGGEVSEQFRISALTGEAQTNTLLRINILENADGRELSAEDQEILDQASRRTEEIREEVAAIERALLESGNQTVRLPVANAADSIRVDIIEARALYKLANAVEKRNSFKNILDKFIAYTADQKAPDVCNRDKTNPTALEVSREDDSGSVNGLIEAGAAYLKKYNRSQIIPSKRKIVEKRNKNFLLINDQYITNERLQPYKLDVSNNNTSEAWRSEFTTPLKICKEVAELIDYEFYADEFGHMRYKPPSYNRILKEHIDIESFKPGVRFQLRQKFPELEVLEKLAIAKLLRQNIEDALRLAVTSLNAQSSGTLVGLGGILNNPIGVVDSNFQIVTESLAGPEGLKQISVNDRRGIEETVLQVDVSRSDQGPANLEVNVLNVEQSAFRDALSLLDFSSSIAEFQDAFDAWEVYSQAYQQQLTVIANEIKELANIQITENVNELRNGLTDDWVEWFRPFAECQYAATSFAQASADGCRPEVGKQGVFLDGSEGPEFPPEYKSLNVTFTLTAGPTVLDTILRGVSLIQEDFANRWTGPRREELVKFLRLFSALKSREDSPSASEINNGLVLRDLLDRRMLSIQTEQFPGVLYTFADFLEGVYSDTELSSVDQFLNKTFEGFSDAYFQLNMSRVQQAAASTLRDRARERASRLFRNDQHTACGPEGLASEARFKELQNEIDRASSSRDPNRQAEVPRLRAELLRCRAVNYRYFVRQRFALVARHRAFISRTRQEFFSERTVSLASLAVSDRSPQIQALIGDRKAVTLITALEVLALEALNSTPFFADEFFIHRLNAAIIYSETFTEKGPDFVNLNVTGFQNFTTLDQQQSGLMLWAGGVDYDLWRTYGWNQQAIQRAFLKSRESVREYCYIMLARQKSRVLSGSVVVRGDSKYKLGDCVYHEDSNLYFYVTGVSHSFTYGSEYTTTLTLEYARRPDEFISHPFDFFGQMELNGDNAELANYSGWESDPSGAEGLLEDVAREDPSMRREN